MPLSGNVRYRFKSLGRGKAVRLAFRGRGQASKVVEVAVFKKVRGVYKKQKTLHQRR